MSTSYGSVVVQFPGFKPLRSGTTDGILGISHWLSGRTLGFTDGTRRRLSKQERSRLLTLAKKWNRGRRHRRKSGRSMMPFNTLKVEHYC